MPRRVWELALFALALTAPSGLGLAAPQPNFEIVLKGRDSKNQSLSSTYSRPGSWGHGDLYEVNSVSFNFKDDTESYVIAVCNEYLSGSLPAATVLLPRRRLTDLAIKMFNFSYLEILPEANYTQICTSYDRTELQFSVGVEGKIGGVPLGGAILPSIELIFRKTGLYSLPFHDVSGLTFDTVTDLNENRFGVYFCEGEATSMLFMVFGSMVGKFCVNDITAVDIVEMDVTSGARGAGACKQFVASTAPYAGKLGIANLT